MKALQRGGAVLVAAAATIAIASQVFGGQLTYVVVSGRSMEPALHTNDVAVALRRSSYERDDVVAFRVPRGDAGTGGIVIHRVLGGTARAGYLTQGDNRTGRDPWRPKPEDVIGKVAFHVPKLGLVSGFLGSSVGLALAAALLAFLGIAGGGKSTMRIPVESVRDVDVEAEPAQGLQAMTWHRRASNERTHR